MGDILFVTWDGGGNVPPAIGIASELQRRGESVRVLGHEQQRTMIEKAGLRFEPYSHPHPFSSTTPEPWLRWITSLYALINDRSLGVDLLASVQRQPTDLVVIDCMLRTVLQAAEQNHIRRAVLVHSFYYTGGLSMGSNGPIARLRGRPSPEPWGGADVALIATLRSLDPDGDKTLPPSIRFTGPVWQGTPQPARQPDGEPRMLVSLSSLWFPGQVRVLQNILDALDGLPVRAVVTTGMAVPAQGCAYRPTPSCIPSFRTQKCCRQFRSSLGTAVMPPRWLRSLMICRSSCYPWRSSWINSRSAKHSRRPAPAACFGKDHHRRQSGKPSNRYSGTNGTGWLLHGWALRSGNETVPQSRPTPSPRYLPGPSRPDEPP